MGKKLVSKTDVISLFGIIYPYIYKFLHDSQNAQQLKSCN